MEVVNINEHSPYLSDVLNIYHSVFPEYERITDDAMIKMAQDIPGITLSAYLEEGSVAAMTFLLDFPAVPFAYLLFLGVSENFQGKGVGSRALNEVKQRCERPVLLEMEVVNDPQAPNPEQRARRQRFYERNGFTRTELDHPYDGVSYDAMIHGAHVTQADLDALDAIIDPLYEKYGA